MKKMLALMLGLLIAATVSAERKTNLVKIQQGDNFNDVIAPASQVLSDKNAGENGISIEASFPKNAGTVGVYNPTLKNWSEAKTLGLDIFNPSQNFLTFQLVIVPKDLKGQTRYNARSDNKITLKPGLNTIKLSTGDFTTNSGSPLNLADITHFYFSPDPKNIGTGEGDAAKTVVYFQNIYLVYP